jgi:hypothetical protein
VYDHRARPWYIQQKERYASTGEAFGWSGVYTFSTSGALGISATAMLHDSNGEPHGVASIDYTLAIISQLVTDELISLRADLATTFAYVVERQGATAGTLMGSSTDSPTDLSSGSVVRLHATAASHPGAAISAEYLDSNGWPVVDGISLSRGEVQVEVGTYSFEDNGLVWLIVVGQYTNCSATDVWDYGKCQTCEGGTEYPSHALPLVESDRLARARHATSRSLARRRRRGATASRDRRAAEPPLATAARRWQQAGPRVRQTPPPDCSRRRAVETSSRGRSRLRQGHSD